MDHHRRLVSSPFPADDGRSNDATRAALAAAQDAADQIAYVRALAALCADRVLVPVTATTTRPGPGAGSPVSDLVSDVPVNDLVSDKEAEMAVVLLRTPDGRRGLLAFSGLDALHAWDPTARPVPVTLDVAAQAALADGATAVLLDVAGPYPLVLEEAMLTQLAGGNRLVELADGDFGWARVA